MFRARFLWRFKSNVLYRLVETQSLFVTPQPWGTWMRRDGPGWHSDRRINTRHTV